MSGSMTVDEVSRCKFNVVEVEEFLRNPPPGCAVQARGAGCFFVKSDPENCLMLVDDFEFSGGTVVFQSSLGREIKMHNLWDYTRVRKSLLSKKIYLLVSLCEEKSSRANKTPAKYPKVLKRFVVSFDGSNPFIKWEMERGLDWTISSVAGESYRLDIDLSEVLETWSLKTNDRLTDRETIKTVWRDTCFTLKYYSDALFDFPHWFGFSKRQFKSYGTRELEAFLEKAIPEILGRDKIQTPLTIERTHRIGPRRDEGEKPTRIIAKFLNYRDMDIILRLAIQSKKASPLFYEGYKIFINSDLFTELYQKRKKYDAVKKKLWEKRIPFTLRFLAELRVKWKEKDIAFKTVEEVAKFIKGNDLD